MKKQHSATYFGYMPNRENVIGGGEVKTKTVLRALKESGRFEHIFAVDTSNWKKDFFVLGFKLLKAMIETKYIIVVQSTSAFLAVLPVMLWLSHIFGNEIHFIPVGNCLDRNFDSNNKINNMNKIKGVYVQSETIKKNLERIGIQNSYVMHNFKYMERCHKHYDFDTPFRYVFLSRISEEKGIFDCISVFNRINESAGHLVCTLDIYGQIDENIKKQFWGEVRNNRWLKYCGIVRPEDTSNILQNYYMMVFPTKYEGEGFPGAVIDAFGAGIPLLTSRFGNFSDMLTDGNDCVSFEFENYEDMLDKLMYCQQNYSVISEMRYNSHKNYEKYLPGNEIKVLIDNFS